MRSGFVIVGREQLDLLVECRFVEDDHMIEALTPDGAYHALDVSSLPRRIIYLLTLVSPIVLPSLSNSPWMRGALPQPILAAHRSNQAPDFARHGRPSGYSVPNFPDPE
jgi:hypothetical protein